MRFGQLLHNAMNAWPKSHVKHTIRLVEHQYPDVLKACMLLVEKIYQAARCCHQHVATFLQCGYLVLVASTTSNNDGLLTGGCANALGNGINLSGQLSRWRDNECAGICVAFGVASLGVTLGTRVGPSGCVALLGIGLLGPTGFLDSNALQRRQHKRCSFTRSRLR